jgi:uncharacterized delta-60 repeat protein
MVLVALAGSLVFAGIAQAFDGVLDPSFSGDGFLLVDGPAGDHDEITAVAVQTDGKIVAAGEMDMDPTATTRRDFAVARYNADGSPDMSFGGGDGVVTTDIGTNTDDLAGRVAIQPDGKLVVAGECNMGATTGFDVCLVRYTDAGAPDLGFGGGDGIVTTNVAPGANEDYGAGVAIEPGTSDWKIDVAGAADMGGTTDYDFLMLRYKSDGSLDTTGFGNPNGYVLTDFSGNHDGDGDFGGAVALQSDGKIVGGGDAFGTGADRDFGVVRYDTDGNLDPTFDGDASMPGFPGNGKVTTTFSIANAQARGVAIQGDGQIVVGGFAGDPSEFALTRYNAADGTLDTSFDGDGRVTTPFPGGAAVQDIAIDPSGRLVVAGGADSDPGGGINRDFAIARYSASNGALDPDLGGDGTVTASIAPGTNSDTARAVAVQTDGRIVVGGFAELVPSLFDSDDFALARFGPGSSLPETTTPGPPASPGSCAGRQATITGTETSDQIVGTARPDVIAGAGGNDTISGLGGNDLLCGGPGNDRLKGGAGKDLLRGEAGKDKLKGGPSRDTCIGGAGRDTAAACERPKSI